MLISPFIRQGDTFLLTGDKGSGKSTITADIILSLVGPKGLPGFGESVSGVFHVKHECWQSRNVCIFDAENDPSEWREFIDTSLEARGIDIGSDTHEHVYDKIFWANARQYDWDNLDWLRGWIKSTLVPDLLSRQIGFVIIDSMHAVWTKDLFRPEWVTGGVEFLRAGLKDAGITLMCLTHTSRAHKDKLAQNEFSPYGTVRQDQACDTMIGIRRNVEDRSITLRLEKRRAGKWNLEKTKASIKLSPTYGGYQRVLSNEWKHEDPKAGKDEFHLTKAECDLLHETGNVEFDMSALTGNKKTMRKVIDSLVHVGILDIRGGKGVKGDPRRWIITEKGRRIIGA